MWRGRETEAQRSRGLNVVLSKLRDLIKTPFISKPVLLNYHLHILLALVPSHLTVIKIYDLVWPRSCCRVASADGLSSSGGRRAAAAGATQPGSRSHNHYTHSCTNYVIMMTQMGKKQVSWTYKAKLLSRGWQPLSSCLTEASNRWLAKKKKKALTLFQHFFQTVNYCVVCGLKRWFPSW